MPVNARSIGPRYDFKAFKALLSEFEKEIIDHTIGDGGNLRLTNDAADALRKGAQRILAFADAIDPRMQPEQSTNKGDE